MKRITKTTRTYDEEGRLVQEIVEETTEEPGGYWWQNPVISGPPVMINSPEITFL